MIDEQVAQGEDSVAVDEDEEFRAIDRDEAFFLTGDASNGKELKLLLRKVQRKLNSSS